MTTSKRDVCHLRVVGVREDQRSNDGVCQATPIKAWFPQLVVRVGLVLLLVGLAFGQVALAVAGTAMICLAALFGPHGEDHSERIFINDWARESQLVAGAVIVRTGLAVRCPACERVLPLHEVPQQSYACGQLGFAVVRNRASRRDLYPYTPYTLTVWRRSDFREARRSWWDLRSAAPSERTETEVQPAGRDGGQPT